MAKMLLAPKIPEKGMPGFLLWARRDNPALYASLCREFPEVRAFDSAVKSQEMLSGFADLFGSIVKSIGTKAVAIGRFVATKALPIAIAAAPVLVAKKEADVAKLQMQLAQAQAAPAQTAIASADGYSYPVAVQQRAGGNYAPVSAMSTVPTWVWIAGGGVALVGLVLLLRKR
jgi:hypothetical protein